MTINILNYSPGQKAFILLETLNVSGVRADGYSGFDGYDGYDGYVPMITRIVYPDLSLANGFPQHLVKLDVGLYYYQFTLPSKANSIGSYLVDVYYLQPGTANFLTALYQIIVNAPFGNYSITT